MSTRDGLLVPAVCALMVRKKIFNWRLLPHVAGRPIDLFPYSGPPPSGG